MQLLLAFNSVQHDLCRKKRKKESLFAPSPAPCSGTGAEPFCQAGQSRIGANSLADCQVNGLGMPLLCVLWTCWHHSPSWAVSVNLQEGKELGEDLLCTSDRALSCFPNPGLVLYFFKRNELCTAAESALGSANYTSVTQGNRSAKASVTDIHKSSWTTQLRCLFTALEVV